MVRAHSSREPMRTANPYVLVLAVSAILVLQVGLASDAALRSDYGSQEREAPGSVFFHRLDLLAADVLIVLLIVLLIGNVRQFVKSRSRVNARTVVLLLVLFLAVGVTHPTLWGQPAYPQLGIGNLLPLIVDVGVLAGLALFWTLGRRSGHAGKHAMAAPGEQK